MTECVLSIKFPANYGRAGSTSTTELVSHDSLSACAITCITIIIMILYQYYNKNGKNNYK